MNDILQSLVKLLLTDCGHFRLSDIRIGVRYCAAAVEPPVDKMRDLPADSNVRVCGLAATLLHEAQHDCGDCFDVLNLPLGVKLEEIIARLELDRSLHRTVALSVCNALINYGLSGLPETKYSPLGGTVSMPSGWKQAGKDDLPLADRKVAMIGFFAPLVPHILDRASCLAIAENDQQRIEGINGDITLIRSLDELSAYDTVILTATSLINNTFDRVMKSCPKASVVLMGPSSPLIPSFFVDSYPQLGMIAGRTISDIDKTLQVVSQTGGTPQFSRYTRKITLSRI